LMSTHASSHPWYPGVPLSIPHTVTQAENHRDSETHHPSLPTPWRRQWIIFYYCCVLLEAAMYFTTITLLNSPKHCHWFFSYLLISVFKLNICCRKTEICSMRNSCKVPWDQRKGQTHPGLHRVAFIGDSLTEIWPWTAKRPVDAVT
jgi:hypothetical protein